MIILSKTHFSELEAHSLEAFPYECCGGMLGVVDGDKKVVERLIRLSNASDENKRRRFKVTQDDYRALEAEAASSNLTLLGFYHSHPDHPAIPSETDLKYAWPFFSYIVQSVGKVAVNECRSYVLAETGDHFVEEELTCS